ncbi:MAG: NAD(P)/FAD-dependent oxidoreductase [Spirulina sp. SIO3F2]|nr:NAD(P)/FAD-dependent oxidoreductase [Spirulina sp. SIO3F2]
MPTYNYDLMVIGNTSTARYAALFAAQQKSRVALVTQGQPLRNSVLRSQSAQHQTQATDKYDPEHPAIAAAQAQLSTYALASAGVDEITVSGTWTNDPHWIWQTEPAGLQARRYLLATGAQIAAPTIAQDLEPVLTLDQLLNQSWAELPEHLTLIGATPTALVTAQSLQRLGKTVTLVTDDRLLPQEDPVVVQRLQAILEAEGIKIYTHRSVTQVQQRGARQGLQAGELEIESDRLIWAELTQPDLAGFPVQQPIRVNRNLRCLNALHLYACGAVLGGYDSPGIGQYEAAIAVHNCLNSRQRTVNYQAVPWVLATNPPLARVGLTPQQAHARYGKAMQIHTLYRQALPSAILTETTTGLCRWVTDEQGRIVGAMLLGQGADVAVGAIALAIQQRLRVDQLPASFWG